MKKLVSHLSYSRVVSTLALFLALGGGAYALSLGKNDVKSRHIAKGAVKSSDVARDTLRGADVEPDALKGSHILEGTFDISQFTAAASTPFNPAGIRCDPEFPSGTPFVPCGSVSLTTPVAGRILVIASGELVANPGGSGRCQLYVDGVEIGSVAEHSGSSSGFATAAVSERLAAGSHLAQLRCLEGQPDLRVEVNGVTAVLVGG